MGRELAIMNTHSPGTEDAPVHTPSGMRVVVFDRDADTLAVLRDAIAGDRTFVLAAESQEWHQCEALLDHFVPELVIANLDRVPLLVLQQLSASTFPLLIGLGNEKHRAPSYDTLPRPLCPHDVHRLLGRARFEIYRRKADELSWLLQCYMSSAGNAGQYLSQLTIEEDNQEHEMAVEHVLYIAADGNYLRIHTHGRAYEIRETMTAISTRLDPSQFMRVHRSFIVNLCHVHDVLTREGSPILARLSNGMEVPVGPNYREEFDNIIAMRNRLSA